MKQIKIAIIGTGPRGVSILERLIHDSNSNRKINLSIYLFDGYEQGTGCHVTDQSENLLLNTAADQITMIPENRNEQQILGVYRKPFDEWIEECINSGKHNNLITTSRQKPKDMYYPRALFGYYLKDVLASLINTVRNRIEIKIITQNVEDITSAQDSKWNIIAGEKQYTEIDRIFLCTGHGPVQKYENKTSENILIEDPFPIKEKMFPIKKDKVVAIQGMGLTTFDVVAELTIGRGGRFVTDTNNNMRYESSGNEPRMILFSRSGLPLLARPVNQKSRIEQRTGKHLTRAVIEKLQVKGKIDFETGLFPLVIKDMEEAYYRAYLRNCVLPTELKDQLVSQMLSGSVDWIEQIEREIPEKQHFSWDKLKKPIPSEDLTDPAKFTEFFSKFLREDLEQANIGNLDSPIKAACDVLRDHRELMALAMDFKGLTGQSQKWFYDDLLPVMKRLSVGPPKERIAQLLALIEAGLVKADFGPDTRCTRNEHGWKVSSGVWPDVTAGADVLVLAKLPVNGPENDQLLRKLVDKGIAKYFKNDEFSSMGLDVTKTLNLIDARGNTVSSIWALGVVTEGTRFYTFFLPRPYSRSRFEEDADIAVRTMFEQLHKIESGGII